MPEPVIVHVENHSAVAGCLKFLLVLIVLAVVALFGFFVLLGRACSSVVSPPAPPTSPSPAPEDKPGPTEVPHAFPAWPEGSGTKITAVTAGSNAALAGLQVGDVITCYNGNAINSADDLRNAVTPPDGYTLDKELRTLLLRRDGKLLAFKVRYGLLGITSN